VACEATSREFYKNFGIGKKKTNRNSSTREEKESGKKQERNGFSILLVPIKRQTLRAKETT